MGQQDSAYDVIIVGAGLAGLASAREAETAGLSTLVLEATERIGGRVHARPFTGTDHVLEFGGNAYSQEFQPLMLAEYQRYGLDEVGTSESNLYTQVLDGEIVTGTTPVPPEQFADLERGLAHWLEGVRRIRFDRPFGEQDLADLDVSIADYFAPLEIPKATLDYLYSWSVHCNGEDADRVSALHMMRWFAAFDNSVWNYYAKAERKWPNSDEYLAKLRSDIRGEIRLNTPVVAVESLDDGVIVTTAAGETLRGGAVIVAAPLNAWKTIAFTPELTGGKAQAAREGHIGNGKVFIRARNVPEGVFATAWEAGIGVVMVNNTLPDGSKLLWAFVNGRRLDTTDKGAVEIALRAVFPEAEVIEIDQDDWRESDFRGGGLTAYGPGQLTAFDGDLRTPLGRIFFANSDLDQKWAGWLEGALSTARTAVDDSVALLQA